MMHWRDAALTFSGMPELARWLASPVPVWLWSRDARLLLWANPAGGRELGLRHFSDLASVELAPQDPLRRGLESAARNAGEAGTLARLRFPGFRVGPLLCRVRRLRSPQGERVLLVEALDARPHWGIESDLLSFFSGADFRAVLVGPELPPGEPADARVVDGRGLVALPNPSGVAGLAIVPREAGPPATHASGQDVPAPGPPPPA
ncbi:hypothetical protein E4O86_16215, partial [Rhizobiales bacterium L72]|nr:hypothetical protein [Propylenella binzhouense]